MYTFLHKFKVLSIFVAFVAFILPHVLLANTPISICTSEEQPCPNPAYQLSYQCIEKGSIKCEPSGQYHKECCDGILVQADYEDKPFCCGMCQPYIPDDSGCCDGTPYSKSWEGCCNGKTFLVAYDTCCNGQIVGKNSCCCNKIIDPSTTGCCNGIAYNKRCQACCDGEVVAAISEIHLTPKPGCNCKSKDPSCFYATLDGSTEPYYAQPCGEGAVIVFPEAICPNVGVQICQHPKCGEGGTITGNPKDGFVLDGVCSWKEGILGNVSVQ